MGKDGCKRFLQFFPKRQPLRDVIIEHIVYPYTHEMSSKSQTVSISITAISDKNGCDTSHFLSKESPSPYIGGMGFLYITVPTIIMLIC